MTDEIARGLEGIAVAETRLSRIDGENGDLVIGGFPVAELASNATYEESVYLLLHDRLPTADELAEFRDDLAGRERSLTRSGRSSDGQPARSSQRWMPSGWASQRRYSARTRTNRV